MRVALLVLAVTLSAVQVANASIGLVQHASKDAGTTTSSSLAFSSNTTAGNWIAVCIRAGKSNQVLTVTDSQGNTYHPAVQLNVTVDTPNGNTLGIFYAENIKGGANTVTVSDTILGTLRFAILEYSGVATANSLDVTVAAQGTNTSPNSGNAPTATANGDLLLGAMVSADPANFAPGSGYAAEERVPAEPNTKLLVEDQIQLTAGAASASASLGASDPWGVVLAAFKPASTVPPSAPAVSLSSTTLSFGDQAVGAPSPPQTVTLTNSGTAPLTISGIASTGDYAQSNDCGTGVAVGGKCTIQVTFTPTTTGSRSGSVSITDNAAGSPQQIALTGNGTAPAVSLSSTTLSFGDQAVGTSSPPQSVILTNSGTAPLTISGITSTGDYVQSNNCGTGVAVGGKCTIQVTFTPTATGTRSGSVSITDNAAGSPQQITLTGNGTTTLSISTSSLPNGTVGVAYNATVSATGGTAGYGWSIVSGLLPAGLTMAATSGQISGTPSAAGNYGFTLQVTDSGAPAQTATHSYSVNVAANPPVITTTSLAAVQNSPYTSTLAASGGVPPYAWLLADGSLPAGLTLSSTGVISGTPTVSGTSSFTVGVTDADNQTASQALSITVSAPPAGLTHGPLVVGSNSHWFVDTTGKAVALSGSHTWNNFQDLSQASPPPAFDYNSYVSFLQAHGHNATILWRKDLPTYCNWGAGGTWYDAVWPWQRTGPGTASDGLPQFDLSQSNQAYFDRLRSKVIALQQAGIYAIVQLFDGLQLLNYRCSNDGYPFTSGNNINSIDDGGETGSMTMSGTDAITNIQDAYVQKVIDTLNDLDNVIWEQSEEAPSNSTWWQSHMISLIHSYEAGKPFQHPVLYAMLTGGSDSTLFGSSAEAVAPGAKTVSTNNQGKVIIEDSDHNYFGMWNDSAQVNRNYVWENFTNGASVIFMDPYEIYWSSENRNLCANPSNGVCTAPDSHWEDIRNNLGYVVSYGSRMNLAAMTPQPSLSSTGYALANASANGEYLVYAPDGGSFTVNLSATPGSLSVEWFNPSNVSVTTSGTVPGGSNNVPFTPPFTGDAILYLKAQ